MQHRCIRIEQHTGYLGTVKAYFDSECEGQRQLRKVTAGFTWKGKGIFVLKKTTDLGTSICVKDYKPWSHRKKVASFCTADSDGIIL